MPNPERQHNALSALEVLFMAARAGIGFYAGRNDASERMITEAEARTINSQRTGAAWSTGEGQYKKWWTTVVAR